MAAVANRSVNILDEEKRFMRIESWSKQYVFSPLTQTLNVEKQFKSPPGKNSMRMFNSKAPLMHQPLLRWQD